MKTPAIEEIIQNNALQSAVNKERTGQGIYIKCLLQMYHELMYSYQPMHISMLLSAIRTNNKGQWSTIDMKSDYCFSEIIDLLMTEWHQDICDNGQSLLRNIFGIEMARQCTCLKCYNCVQKNNLCWQHKIPITMHCFRYWSIENDSIDGTFIFITPEQLVSKDTVDKIFPLVVGDIESLDDDEMKLIELSQEQYLKVNGQIKYAVYVTCLTRTDKMCAWTAYNWFEKIKETVKYNTQFKYTLVFQKITNTQDITDFHYYDIQQFHITGTQTYFPKTYPRMKWLTENKNVMIQTHEISNSTQENQCKIHPPQGDSILTLAEQLEWTNKHGYLEYLHCTRCKQTQPMKVQTQISKFNQILILNLVQYPTQYYELSWNPDAHMQGLSIKKNNQSINVSIKGYITAERKKNIIKYATHWRTKSKKSKWQTLCNNKYIQSSNGIDSKHACLLFAFRFNHHE